jgi:tRNA(Ile)-lysidine synthase
VLQRVAEVITRYNMFPRGARLGVAVSGGADSVCLLRLLHDLAQSWDLALTVLHLDHGLRGAESRADAAFVEALAAQLGCGFLLREAAIDSTGNLEQAARDARLAFFRDAMRDQNLAAVATGHTRDDQAETVLFRFLRGSGTAGLAGIRPVTADGIVRPLLETSRAEIEAWLRECDFGWREDSTNATGAFARNRIRHGLLPQLERDWNPALRDTLCQTAEWARAEEAYWEAEVERRSACLVDSGGFVLCSVEDLTPMPVAAARRVVRRAIERVKGDLRGIDFAHVESILGLARDTEGHGRVQAAGIDVFRSFNRMRFGPIVPDGIADRNFRVDAPIPGVARVDLAGIELSLELIEMPEGFNRDRCVYNVNMGWLDRARLPDSLVLRNWRPGDQYQPMGRSRAEKIKTLFQEFRIPIWERRHWPILLNGDSIVWARQFGAAVEFAAGTGCVSVLEIRESQIGSAASNKVALNVQGAEVS